MDSYINQSRKSITKQKLLGSSITMNYMHIDFQTPSVKDLIELLHLEQAKQLIN